MYYQKHEKSTTRFEFTLKKYSNFNYFILVNIIDIDDSPILHIIIKSTRF